MIPKRTFWTTVGYGLGVGSSFYVQRRVRRTVDRLAPAEIRREVSAKGQDLVGRARATGGNVVAAVREGRRAMREEDAALREEFGLPRRRMSA